MNNKRVFLFIDSSNVYHAVKKSNYSDFFDYKTFCYFLSNQFNVQRVYFYDAIKNRKIEPEGYARQQAFHERLFKSIPNFVIRTRKLRYMNFSERLDENLESLNLCELCFLKVKQLLSSLGLFKASREKGIDILLGADMIKGGFEDKYDVALLLSGDADFIPAIELIKELGKEVINIHFYLGSSIELRQKCTSHKLVWFNNKGELFLK